MAKITVIAAAAAAAVACERAAEALDKRRVLQVGQLDTGSRSV